jgi:hypothetical protein
LKRLKLYGLEEKAREDDAIQASRRLMGSGGGTGGGTTQYNWNDDMAPQWRNAIAQANSLSQTPYQQYGGQVGQFGQAYNGGMTTPGQRIADLTAPQQNAMNNIKLYTSDPTYGVKDPNQSQNAGIQQEADTLNGKYLNSDPYASAQNPYGGMNSQYFQSTLDNGLSDMTRAYQMGTAADTTRMFNQAGAFGGSAYSNAVGANQNALAHQMGEYISGMQNDQYNRSANLVQQQNQLGSQAYQNERQRQMGAIGSAQNEQGLTLQRANALMGVGDAQRSYNQDLINQGYNDFQSQRQYPYSQLDYLTGLLSRAQGGMAPNSTTQTSGYGASPFSSILGGALVGSSLLGGH